MAKVVSVEFRKLVDAPSLPTRMWLANSESQPGMQHITMELADGNFICTCRAGQLRGECWHINKAKTL